MSGRAKALEASLAWEGRACLDLEPREADRLFYRASGLPEAQVLCEGCPVLLRCRNRALDIDRTGEYAPHGFVGGLRADQRAAIIRTEQSRTLAS